MNEDNKLQTEITRLEAELKHAKELQQAVNDGKPIQMNDDEDALGWISSDSWSFDSPLKQYRVKPPKPREFIFSDLLGKTLASVENHHNDEVVFTTTEGEKYKLYHSQDCCESVSVEDVIGDFSDLIGSPITMAEEVTQVNENPEGVEKEYQDSFTWTFYKLATVKGYVTIRWYGESNGYYSESVDFCKLT